MQNDYSGSFKLFHLLLTMLCIIALLTGCASDGMKSIYTAPTSTAVTTEANQKQKYLIGPEDQLKIFVWGDQELSTDVVVRPDGLISTPLVEDMQASGKTPTELARNLEQALSKYVKNPKVTVSVSHFVGQYTEQVRVVGQAAQPQAIPYREGMTLLDVIIAVGGLTEFADGNKASIVRKANGVTQQYRVKLDDLIRYGDISANVDMLPGDVLIIPETWF
jgi:polysaccharide export outer membrane protein